MYSIKVKLFGLFFEIFNNNDCIIVNMIKPFWSIFTIAVKKTFKILYLLIFLFVIQQGNSQLSKIHYIPPLATSNSSNNAPNEQWFHISTPSENDVNFTIKEVMDLLTTQILFRMQIHGQLELILQMLILILTDMGIFLLLKMRQINH